MKYTKKLSSCLSVILICLLLLGAVGCDNTSTSTEKPTAVPTEAPTAAPTEAPTVEPTEAPTAAPTEEPTTAPTEEPTDAPTEDTTVGDDVLGVPSEDSTEILTGEPTDAPTEITTEAPTATPTEAPTEIPTEEPTEASTESPIVFPDYGNKVGDLCYETDLVTYGGETFNITQTRGKITVINFWGTWCPYCLYELPDFNVVANNYAENVAIIAIHSSGDTDGRAYVDRNFPNTKIIFANDPSDSDAYYWRLGAEGYFPMTFILDENGVIAYIHVGMISYNTLVSEIQEILSR